MGKITAIIPQSLILLNEVHRNWGGSGCLKPIVTRVYLSLNINICGLTESEIKSIFNDYTGEWGHWGDYINSCFSI